MSSSYQPFAITEFKTGLFNYLEPWIRPNEAFEPLSNAYVYRGTLNKRQGYITYGLTGQLAYRDNGVNIGVGDGTKHYTGTTTKHPIIAGSFSATTRDPATGALIETFTDNGLGVLTGSAGGTGTINYTTGAWVLDFNANLGAGIIIRGGYSYYPLSLSTPAGLPIMGIKQFTNESTDTNLLVVCDTRRASLFNTSSRLFTPLSTISQTLWVGDNATTSISFNVGWTNIAPDSVTISDGPSTINDNGVGGFTASGNLLGTSTINYTTGVVLLNITAANTRTYTITFSLQGDYFTGNNTNFFNATNWKPTTSATAYLYLTNDIDRITLFDGTNLSRPPFPITRAHQITYTNDITTTLDIKVYKNRLLLLRPIVLPNLTADGQSIRWSALFNPTNLVADVAGNGGELSAPTDDWLFSDQFLRDVLVVFFERTAWTFRFTGNAFDPFRFDKVNNSKTTSAPYASVGYDQRVTSVGSRGFIACDGVNVDRYDISVIDQFEEINQEEFQQCFAQRYDNLNQTWMLYPSTEANSTTSDMVVVYNFLEETWATYNLPLSCLGLFQGIKDAVWNDFAVNTVLGDEYPDWDSADFNWTYFVDQKLAPVLLGGSQEGLVFEMDNGITDNGTVISSQITSTRWNPFFGTGERVQFGYIDFYYKIDADVTLNLTFFADNSSSTAMTRTLTLDGPVNSDTAWKRIYINCIGEFIRLEITDSSASTYKILGMILWARPSGRLTP
jgi:hypothetical protein